MAQRNPRRRSAEWAQIIEQYQRSGLSVQAFCEQNNLVAVTLQKWKRRLLLPPVQSANNKPAFTPALRVSPSSAPAPIPSAGSSVNLRIGSLITLTISLEGSTHEQ